MRFIRIFLYSNNSFHPVPLKWKVDYYFGTFHPPQRHTHSVLSWTFAVRVSLFLFIYLNSTKLYIFLGCLFVKKLCDVQQIGLFSFLDESKTGTARMKLEPAAITKKRKKRFYVRFISSLWFSHSRGKINMAKIKLNQWSPGEYTEYFAIGWRLIASGCSTHFQV